MSILWCLVKMVLLSAAERWFERQEPRKLTWVILSVILDFSIDER